MVQLSYTLLATLLYCQKRCSSNGLSLGIEKLLVLLPMPTTFSTVRQHDGYHAADCLVEHEVCSFWAATAQWLPREIKIHARILQYRLSNLPLVGRAFNGEK